MAIAFRGNARLCISTSPMDRSAVRSDSSSRRPEATDEAITKATSISDHSDHPIIRPKHISIFRFCQQSRAAEFPDHLPFGNAFALRDPHQRRRGHPRLPLFLFFPSADATPLLCSARAPSRVLLRPGLRYQPRHRSLDTTARSNLERLPSRTRPSPGHARRFGGAPRRGPRIGAPTARSSRRFEGTARSVWNVLAFSSATALALRNSLGATAGHTHGHPRLPLFQHRFAVMSSDLSC